MADSNGIIDRPRFIKAANTFVPVGVLVAVILSGATLAGWWSDRNVEDAKSQTLQIHRIDTLYERLRKTEKRLELLELRARNLEVTLGVQQKTSNP